MYFIISHSLVPALTVHHFLWINEGFRFKQEIFISHISGCVSFEDWMNSNSPETSEDTKPQIQTHTVTVTIIISVLIKATGGKSHITDTVYLHGPKFWLMVKKIHNFMFFII